MGIVLGPNQYGKAETRVVRVYRDQARHELRDLNVSTALWGEFTDAHVRGDQGAVLPTDTQKNTVFAYAKERGVAEIERYALGLATHFVTDVAPVRGARVAVEEYAWERIRARGRQHDHSWVRSGQEVRTAVVTVTAGGAPDADSGAGGEPTGVWVVSGLKDLVLLKSTGSEFRGFLRDRYTTLAETDDRVLATSLLARWRYVPADGAWDVDYDDVYDEVRRTLLEQFAAVHSLALQQTLWEMGRAVLEARPEIAEIRLSAPNRHHVEVDLTPFGLDNPNEVFHAADRPCGLIECAVVRDDAPDAGPAWGTVPAFT